MFKNNLKKVFSFVAIMAISNATHAGLYSDDLSRCLVEKSSEENKTTLTKWMFTALSLHPAVSSMSGVSASDIEISNKEMADMFMDLMTVKCKAEAAKAIKYEGGLAIQQGFMVFGQVAGQSLFQHPKVAASMSGLDKYMDKELLEKELGIEKSSVE